MKKERKNTKDILINIEKEELKRANHKINKKNRKAKFQKKKALKTEENQKDDYYMDQGVKIYPGYYARPTDQRITFSLFFQDYLPNNPTLQVHLNLSYGSAIPVSPPRSVRYDQTVPMGPYRRVDMGLSKTLKDDKNPSSIPLINKLKEMKLSLEIFNLLNIRNKASYLWIHTVNNQENQSNEFAVPNYLTSRRINFKLAVKF